MSDQPDLRGAQFYTMKMESGCARPPRLCPLSFDSGGAGRVGTKMTRPRIQHFPDPSPMRFTLQTGLAFFCGLQFLNLLVGCMAIRFYLARQAATVSASPAPLVVELGRRAAVAGISGVGWGGHRELSDEDERSYRTARFSASAWKPSSEASATTFPSPTVRDRKGLLLYVLQPDTAPELREGLAEVIARYTDRFVPVSGEGAGTALPVTFHRYSSGSHRTSKGDDEADVTDSDDGESRARRKLKCVVDSTGALRVYYSHRADAFRALGRLMVAAHNAPFGTKPGAQAALAAGMQFEEAPWLELMGVQLDCSRGGVPHVASLQDWAVQISLYGYNALLLYMEDVYEVQGETFFGHMRGRYSKAELAEVGRVAAAVGIEVIPAIQTLGHLEHVLHWPANAKYRDNPSVLLAGDDDGHDLIERMMAAVTEPLKARRIHLGLDETFGLGQGRYREKRCGKKKRIGFGAECGPTPEASLIYEEHVQRVLDIAQGLGLRPALYTDMMFRFGAGGAGTAGGDGKGDGEAAYRDPGMTLSSDTIARMNAALGEDGLDLVYWDYSSSSKDHYLAQLHKHEPLVNGNNTADGKRELMMSLGLWTWNRFWAALHWGMATMEAGVAAAEESGIPGIYVTAWADDGAEHAPISAAAGVAFFAELTRLNARERSRPNVLQRAEESFPVIMRSGGASFKDVLDTCAIDQAPGVWLMDKSSVLHTFIDTNIYSPMSDTFLVS